MKKKLVAALVLTLAASILTTGGAFAQQPGGGHGRAPTQGADVTEYTFNEHRVDGGPTGPDGMVIPARLRTRRDTLIQPRVLAQLRGDTAFISSQGVACYTLGGQRVFREVSYFTRAEAFLLTHWLALPFIVALASALLFVGVRLALEHRKGGTRPLTRSGGSAGAPPDATEPPPAA